MRGWSTARFLAVPSVLCLAVACGSGHPTEACPSGAATCACAEGAACNAGLNCVNDVCVASSGGGGGGTKPGTGGGSTSSTTSQAPACVGTPTASCTSPTCDKLPGCVAASPSTCTGTAKPCSTFDTKTTPCKAQWGCGPDVGGTCSNVVARCSDAPMTEGEYGCKKILGCSYQDYYCVGTVVDCSTLNAGVDCRAQAACSWEPGDVAYCEGTALACDAMRAADCATQQGCAFTKASCSGAPTPCQDLPLTECTTQPGCKLVGTTNPGGTGGAGGAHSAPVRLPDLVPLQFRAYRSETAGKEPGLYFSLEEGNRGVVDAPAHAVRVVLSTDEVIGNADDLVLMDLDEPYGMPAFETATTSWGPTLYTMSSITKDHPSGNYYVGVILDSGNKVAETEEANNIAVSPLVFIGVHTVDLAAVSVTTDASSTLSPGDKLGVTVTVKNSSTKALTSVPVQLLLSSDATRDAADVPFCSTNATVTLGVGEQTTIPLSCTVPQKRGSYYVLAELDASNTLSDVNRANNTVATSTPISVTAPSPDLVMSDVATTTTHIPWKGSLDVSASVKNIGVDPVGATTVSFYLSSDTVVDAADTVLCTVSISGGVAAGATVPVSKTCAAPADAAGSRWLLAKADPSNAVFELDETNNTAAAAAKITVDAPNWNLSAGPLSFSTSTISSVGQTLTFQLSVANKGTDAIPGYYVEVYLSPYKTVTPSDTVFCFMNKGALAASVADTFTFSCKAPTLQPGTYYFGAIVDPNNDLLETNETDNTVVYDLDTVTVDQ